MANALKKKRRKNPKTMRRRAMRSRRHKSGDNRPKERKA